MVHVTVLCCYAPDDVQVDEYLVRDTAAGFRARFESMLRGRAMCCVVDAGRGTWTYIPETVRWFVVRELPLDPACTVE